MSTAIVVRWHGPLSFDDACTATFPGLYLVWGRNRRGRNPVVPKMLYVGISENKFGVGRRIYDHRDDPYAHPDNDWWVGRIVAPEDSTRRHLEDAEGMLIYFGGTEHNDRKAWSPPRTPCHLINEWYRADDTPWTRPRGAPQYVADAISWWPETRSLRWAERMRSASVEP